jgi:hypothetical protein
MANKPKLKVRIPFLLEAAAEGHLAIVLLFALDNDHSDRGLKQ